MKCTKGAAASQCKIPKAYGKGADVSVTAFTDAGQSAATEAKYQRAAKPIVFGTVHFTPDSADLDRADRRALRKWTRVLAAQGFTSLTLDGYTAESPAGGNPTFRRQLSLARAQAVYDVVRAQLDRLGADVEITLRARGGSDPVGNNGPEGPGQEPTGHHQHPVTPPGPSPLSQIRAGGRRPGIRCSPDGRLRPWDTRLTRTCAAL